MVDAGPEPTYEEKMRVTPSPPPPPPPPPPGLSHDNHYKSCRFVGGRDSTVALPA